MKAWAVTRKGKLVQELWGHLMIFPTKYIANYMKNKSDEVKEIKIEFVKRSGRKLQ